MQIITGLDTVAMSQDVTYKIIIKVIKKAQLSLTILSIFIRLAVVAFQNREITRNSDKI